MPGIDYAELRRRLRLGQVLELLGFRAAASRCGAQVRGPCPVHGSRTAAQPVVRRPPGTPLLALFPLRRPRQRPGPVVAVTKLPLYEAALDLCRRSALDRSPGCEARRAASPQPAGPETTPDRAVELEGLTEASQGRTPPRKLRTYATTGPMSPRSFHASLFPTSLGFDWPAARRPEYWRPDRA